MERSALDFDEIAKRAIDKYHSPKVSDRRRKIGDRVLMLSDDWDPQLRAAMSKWLSRNVLTAVIGENKDVLDISRNVFRAISEELCVLYIREPHRSFDDEKNTSEFNRVIDGSHFTTFWQTVELNLHACNDVVIWPTVVTRNGKRVLFHNIATGADLDITPHPQQPTEPWIVTYELPLDDRGKTYAIWTPEWHGQFTEIGGQIVQTGPDPIVHVGGRDIETGFGGFENPYRELPHVFIHATYRSKEFWDSTTGRDLTDSTIGIGKMRTLSNYSWKMGSFKQPAITGNMTKPPPMVRDEAEPLIARGDNVSIQLMDLQFDSRQRREWMESDTLNAAASRGISPERLKKSASHQTAAAARIADRGLVERRLKTAPIMEQAEREYYRKVAIVSEAHGVSTRLDREARLNVVYAPFEYAGDPGAEGANLAAAFATGVDSAVQYVMRRNPTMTADEAKSSVIEAVNLHAEISRIKQNSNAPEIASNRSRSDETNGSTGPIVRDQENDG